MTTPAREEHQVKTYRCTFKNGQVGRDKGVAPLTVTADTPDEVAAQVFKVARRHLLSSSVEVEVDLQAGQGWIVVGGYRTVGEFTVKTVSTEKVGKAK